MANTSEETGLAVDKAPDAPPEAPLDEEPSGDAETGDKRVIIKGEFKRK